ncbi:MAG: DUF424 family protein [Candidatus Nanoarchaeia archaeon]|nr:DUF424 family protein [Candidatus Nanoarchaeia archaeon]
MQLKIHEAYRKIVALADTSLIGKTFSEGIKQIEIKPGFFQGEEKSQKEVLKILKDMEKEDATFNIVGKEAIETAIEARIISKNGIIEIDGIPIALGLM